MHPEYRYIMWLEIGYFHNYPDVEECFYLLPLLNFNPEFVAVTQVYKAVTNVSAMAVARNHYNWIAICFRKRNYNIKYKQNVCT